MGKFVVTRPLECNCVMCFNCTADIQRATLCRNGIAGDFVNGVPVCGAPEDAGEKRNRVAQMKRLNETRIRQEIVELTRGLFVVARVHFLLFGFFLILIAETQV